MRHLQSTTVLRLVRDEVVDLMAAASGPHAQHFILEAGTRRSHTARSRWRLATDALHVVHLRHGASELSQRAGGCGDCKPLL